MAFANCNVFVNNTNYKENFFLIGLLRDTFGLCKSAEFKEFEQFR